MTITPCQYRMARAALQLDKGPYAGFDRAAEQFAAGQLRAWDGAWAAAIDLHRRGARFARGGRYAGGVHLEKSIRGFPGPEIGPAQARMARAALSLEQSGLRDVVGLTFKAIGEFEAGLEADPGIARALRVYFESQGIEFIQTGKMAGGVWPGACHGR